MQARNLSVDFITYLTVIQTETYSFHVSLSKSFSDKTAGKEFQSFAVKKVNEWRPCVVVFRMGEHYHDGYIFRNRT